MDWIEQAYKYYEDIIAAEDGKSRHLIIKRPEDVPVNCSGLQKVSVLPDAKVTFPLVPLLQRIIASAPELVYLSFASDVTWDEVCSLDLTRIETLSVSLKGLPGTSALYAPFLKDLSIHGDLRISPMKAFANGPVHFDFSGVPQLNSLTIKYIANIDPEDFRRLDRLERLVIWNEDITGLDWLCSAGYRLKTLFLDCPVEDCSGIASQPDLVKLSILNPRFTNASPIEKLENLQMLDLSGQQLKDESSLRSKSIPCLILNRRDEEIQRILGDVNSMLWDAMGFVRGDEKRFDEIGKLPEIQKKLLLDRLSKSFHERVQYWLEHVFRCRIESFDDAKVRRLKTVSKVEYAELFLKFALEKYPFLEDVKLSAGNMRNFQHAHYDNNKSLHKVEDI